MKPSFLLFWLLFPVTFVWGAEPQLVWPDLAPGETTKSRGRQQPFRAGETPPVIRMEQITQPTFTVHLAPEPTGGGVVILPGGGFGKVVTNKEGTEAADWLNEQGLSAFVLSYRTSPGDGRPAWQGPLQDAQRTLSLVRSRAEEWGLKKDRIGLLGFSAGGQVAARVLGAEGKRAYETIDPLDEVSFAPDFALLIYPWNIHANTGDGLIDEIKLNVECPPTFLLHTDDDRASSLSSVLFYTELKRLGVPAELHVYGNGGHGYGLRKVSGSEVSTWPKHAEHWLRGIK